MHPSRIRIRHAYWRLDGKETSLSQVEGLTERTISCEASISVEQNCQVSCSELVSARTVLYVYVLHSASARSSAKASS